MGLTFRRLERTDFELLCRWLNTPHVYEWWGRAASSTGLGGPGDLAATIGDLEARFGRRIDEVGSIHYYIVELECAPIGLIQFDPHMDAAEVTRHTGETDRVVASIDYLIGEPDWVSRGLGSRMIDAFVRSVAFADSEVDCVMADPDIRNHRSIRALEKAGFSFARDIEVPGEPAPFRVMVRWRDSR